MKICILTTAFPRWKNDPRAPFILEAALALQRLGHTVRVVAMHNPGAKTYENWDGLEVFRPKYLPERWEILQKDTGGLPVAWKTNPWAKLAILPFVFRHTLAAIQYGRNCDIFHANWILSGMAAWAGTWLHCKPYVVTVQGSDVFKAPKNFLIRSVIQKSLKHAKRIIALSNALAEGVKGLGAPPGNILVIPNGVNIEQFSYSKRAQRYLRILFVGSLIDRKAPGLLIQAFAAVATRFPGAELVMIGEGDLKSKLEQEVIQMGLQSRVTFKGLQSQSQVGNWMQTSQILVLPSLEEGQGVVLVEALACGTPLIGTQVGGIPDVITSDVGFLVPPNDVVALSDSIMSLLADPIRWEKYSENARLRAEKVYDWDEIAKRISEAYLL